MSLVAYASSDESSSDSEAAPESEVNAEEQEAEPAADYSGECEGEQQQDSPGYCGPPPGLGYRPPGYYGHGGYGAGPPTYPSAQGYGGYSNSQGPSVYSHMGYGPQGPTHVNFPPPGLNLPPPQHGPNQFPLPTRGSAMNLPLPPPQRAHGPLQGGPGLNLPPPQGNHGLNLPHPQGGNGLKLPPPQSGPGINHPPPQSGTGINHPPPQSGSVINLPPPQSGTGMNLPPLQKSTGMNLPPPHSSTGLNLPRHEMGTVMNLPPPQSSPGMSVPPPHGVCPQSATGMNQPSPASPGVMHQPPLPGASAMNLPPPQGGSGLSFPPPSPGMNPPPAHGLNLPQSGQVLNIPPPQLSPTSASAIDHRIPLPTPAYNVNLPPASIENVAIPKPKKRTEPVKITVPEVHGGGSDSEEDEPVRKKAVVQHTLSDVQNSVQIGQTHAQPLDLERATAYPRSCLSRKNASGSDSKRQPLPYDFTKKASDSASDLKHPKTTSLTKPKLSSKPEVSNTPSPSAIKAAAKNAALQVTKQITQEEDEESDEDLQHGNFFSLSDIKETPAMMSDSSPYPGPTADEIAPPGVEPVELQNDAANAPLDFKTAAGSIDNHQGGAPTTEAFTSQPYRQYPEYPDTSASGYYQDYNSSGYYQESDSSLTTAAADSIMDDEAFKRLQGKRNQGREEINFVEIKGDDQLSGNQQWMTKSLTEEKTMKSFSKRKGEQPTGQQRRKHQITYLIHQAKERELELKNSWSDNKLSRRQTQAKYGF